MNSESSGSMARPLPVILLVDISGSMSKDGKIQALNAAVSDMIKTFAEEEDGFAQIQVAVITFGHEYPQVFLPLQSAARVEWQNMEAKGKTPLGAACSLAEQMLQDEHQIPIRAYTPTLVLVSDGSPTDDWQIPFRQLLQSKRGAKAARFAMAIGDDANMDVLRAFVSDPSQQVFQAHEARQVKKFFQWVSFSVTERSRSVNPNQVPATTLDNDF